MVDGRRPAGTRGGRLAAVVAPVLALAGCGWISVPPDPDRIGKGMVVPEAPIAGKRAIEIAPLAPPEAAPGGRVSVARGDTVYGIARRAGVPVRDLIEVNGLVPPYLLREGQDLALPVTRYHSVQKGETVTSIARLYGVGVTSLVRVNGITQPFTIKVGQKLRLPAPLEGAQFVAAEPVTEIDAPMGARPEDERSVGAPPENENWVGTPLDETGEGMRDAAPAPPAGLASTRPIPEPPRRAGRNFIWPVDGEITLSYGRRQGGVHNDGINIRVARGVPVQAAENGIVAYAGNEVRGFGNLLLIRHADQWMTAYAHLDAMSVRRGDRVKRGQTIGHVGSTGSVDSPQLHFEVRRGSRAIDPELHLAPRSTATTRKLG